MVPPITAPARKRGAFSSHGARIALVASLILVVALLGSLFIYGTYNVVRTTPQEALGLAHDEETRGPYPLRALVIDSRRGLVRDIAPHERHERVQEKRKKTEQGVEVQYVLLLHGVKSTSELWLALVEQWLQNARCNVVFVLPDLLGHGKSPWPPQGTTLDVARHLRSLRALLERTVPADAPLHIAGHSLGAQLALELCANLLLYPSKEPPNYRLKSLTLMSAPYFASASEAHEAAERHSWWFRNPALAHVCCGFLLCRQHWVWRPALRRYFHKYYPALPESVYEAAWQHSRHSIESCVRDAVIEHRPMRAARTVRESDVPVLLIDGANDQLCCDARKALAKDLAPFCTAILLRDAAHNFVGTHVGETTQHLRAFVEAIACPLKAENKNVLSV
jgi:pimeloyl-ACP methyl ester carboxylesterase